MEKELNPPNFIHQFCIEDVDDDDDGIDMYLSKEEMDDILKYPPKEKDDYKNNSTSTLNIVTNNDEKKENTKPQRKKIILNFDDAVVHVSKKEDTKLKPIPTDFKISSHQQKQKQKQKMWLWYNKIRENQKTYYYTPNPKFKRNLNPKPNLIEMESVPKEFQSSPVDNIIYLTCCRDYNQKAYRLEDVILHIVKGL